MLVTEFGGIPLTSQRVKPGNTSTAIDANIYFYKEHFMKFDSGDYDWVAGDVIVGATSGATAVVISYVDDGAGTVGGGDLSGTLRLRSVTGTWANDEKIKCAAQADQGDVNGTVWECTDNYPHRHQYAKTMLISVSDNTVIMALDGSIPDQTQLQGHELAAGTSYILASIDTMSKCRFIDHSAGSAGIIGVTGFF